MEVLAHGPITVRQDRLKVATVAITIINDTLTIFRHIFAKPINMTHFSFVTHRKLLDLLSGCKMMEHIVRLLLDILELLYGT